jgi:hypothetical protein
MEKSKQQGRIEPYRHPAAAWGALKYVAINPLKKKVAGDKYKPETNSHVPLTNVGDMWNMPASKSIPVLPHRSAPPATA